MDSKDSGPNEEPAQQPTSQEDFTAEEPKNTVSELEKQDDKETKTQNNDQQHLGEFSLGSQWTDYRHIVPRLFYADRCLLTLPSSRNAYLIVQ